MVHLLLNILVVFYYNAFYMKKCINMWAQLCESREIHTPKSLLTNTHLLFELSQGSTQGTTVYLGTIRNLIYCCKSGGEDFSKPLVNLIAT